MINNCVAGAPKGFFDDAVGAQFAKRSEAPAKAAPKKPAPSRPASAGFFDGAVGSQFATRTASPTKAAPKQAAPKPAASTSGKLVTVVLPHSKSVSY